MALERLRAVADYLFGPGAGKALFPDDVVVERSKSTGRVRHVYHDGRLVASFRPDGTIALTVHGAERLVKALSHPRVRVVVSEDAVEPVSRGRSVFAKHVVEADPEVRPGDEVVVVDRSGRVLAVGRAAMSGWEMPVFRRGVAVRVRRGCLNSEKRNSV